MYCTVTGQGASSSLGLSTQENEKTKLVAWPLAGLKIEREGKVLYSVRNVRRGLVVKISKCPPHLHLSGATWVEFLHASFPNKD